MLKEINTNKKYIIQKISIMLPFYYSYSACDDLILFTLFLSNRAKEIETQLLTACKEDLLRIAEYEEAEENQEEGISTEQQYVMQKHSDTLFIVLGQVISVVRINLHFCFVVFWFPGSSCSVTHWCPMQSKKCLQEK